MIENEKHYIKLSPRLNLCAKFVPQNAVLADIGTDHGYLPISLLQTNKIFSALACDINEEPLNSAKSNAKKQNVDIKTVLSNGFAKLNENDFTCATIAGMGGELITKIIDECNFLQDKTLVLQPMTKADKLREYLYENGFYIEKEEAVMDKGKIYSVMLVKFGNQDKPCMFMGKIEPKTEFSKQYATSVVNNLENKLKGIGENKLIEEKVNEIKELYLNDC